MLTVINTIITPTMNTLSAKDRTQYRTQILMRSFPKLRKSLEDKGFRCLFIIVEGSNDTRISYEQYLEHVMESRCIVDFFQHGQVGLTRRPMESLFFNKKLLTENPHILEFDFYHPENIFVLGRDDFSQIRKFLESKPVLVPDDIKRQYDVSQWLRHFD